MKNKYLTYLLLILVASFFSSCIPERREIELTFVFDKPLEETNKYPAYFKEISTPFSAKCGEEATDFLFKPISVTRLDVSQSPVQTNAWYFKDIGDNTIEFSKLWLDIYFKDSIPPAHLFAKPRIETNIDKYIEKNKENIFILSEDSDAEMYKEVPIYNSSTELYNAIQKKTCDNTSGKIMVLVNPGYSPPGGGGSPPPPPPPVKNEIIIALENKLNKIGNYKLPTNKRDELSRSTLSEFFTEDAKVKVFLGSVFIEERDASLYLDYLSTYQTLSSLKITEFVFDMANKKVRKLKIQEVHQNVGG
jgi:hypothetical protein